MEFETSDIDVDKFEGIVDVMEERKDFNVDMNSIKVPVCNTPGCFAGELYLAMNNLGVPSTKYQIYNYDLQANRFVNYITNGKYSDSDDMLSWAYHNPNIWRNNCGLYMFKSIEAFGKYSDSSNKITINEIINHLRNVIEAIKQHMYNGEVKNEN